jgi:hypothetical protein
VSSLESLADAERHRIEHRQMVADMLRLLVLHMQKVEEDLKRIEVREIPHGQLLRSPPREAVRAGSRRIPNS